MNSTGQTASQRLAGFEQSAALRIAMTDRITATTPANGKRAQHELIGRRLRWSTDLIHNHGLTTAEIRAAWDRASRVAREIN